MADETKTKRAEKSKRIFIQPDGSHSVKPTVETTAFQYIEMPTGDMLEVSAKELFGAATDMNKVAPGAILSAWFGLKTNLGNAHGGKDSTMEDVRARHEFIMSGEWSEGAGEKGPRKTILAEAFVRAKAEAGEEISMADAIAKISALSKENKAKLSEDARVALQYEEILAERRKAKMKELKAAVKDASGSLDDLV